MKRSRSILVYAVSYATAVQMKVKGDGKSTRSVHVPINRLNCDYVALVWPRYPEMAHLLCGYKWSCVGGVDSFPFTRRKVFSLPRV